MFKNAIGITLKIFFLLISFNSFSQGRYDLPGDYVEDISAVQAYLLTQVNNHRFSERPVIIDVRDVEEYVKSHARKAVSIPYPHIYKRPNSDEYIGQNPKVFFEAVASHFAKDKVIFVVCHSGYRSNLAANILANPSAWIPEFKDLEVEGFSQVYNIWEGMEGRYRIAIKPQEETIPIIDNQETGEAYVLDLNNNGVMDLGDKDGWLGHLDLPYSTKLKNRLLYQPYLHLYYPQQ